MPDRASIANVCLDRVRTDMLSFVRKAGHAQFNRRRSSAEKTSYAISGSVTNGQLRVLQKRVQREGKLAEYIQEKQYFKQDGQSVLNRLLAKDRRSTQASIFGFLEQSGE